MRSSIGEMTGGEYHLRGKAVSEYIGAADFTSMIWLTWMGSDPSKEQRDLLEACLVASIDHGAEPPSTHVARTIASCGKPLADAIAAGVLAFGPRHGNAAGAASAALMEAVQSGISPDAYAASALEEKRRLPGFGHPKYEVDPRAFKLTKLAKELLPSTPHVDFAVALSAALSRIKGKPLPLNIDGAIGAIVADLGIPTEIADAIFLTARVVGMVAHAREEAAASLSYRRG